MSDSEVQNQPASPGKSFKIQKIYVKDISYEAPNTPQVFLGQQAPEISQQLKNASITLSEGIYEVSLTITVTVKNGDSVAYLIEVQQAGIFEIQGYEETELGELLGSYCPTMLFPYVREAISDLAVRGGFAQLLLPPVNFEALYTEYLKHKEQQQVQLDDEARH